MRRHTTGWQVVLLPLLLSGCHELLPFQGDGLDGSFKGDARHEPRPAVDGGQGATEGFRGPDGAKQEGPHPRDIATMLDAGPACPSKTWCPLGYKPTTEGLYAIAGSGTTLDDVYAVGTKGAVLKYSSSSGWSKLTGLVGTAPADQLYGVAVPTLGEPVIVGAAGYSASVGPGGWNSVWHTPEKDLHAVAFGSATEGLAVGNNGTTWEIKGSSWAVGASFGSPFLRAVAAVGSTYHVVGSGTTHATYQLGGSPVWNPWGGLPAADYNAIWATSGGGCLAGENPATGAGVLACCKASASCTPIAITCGRLRGVWGTGNKAWVVGDSTAAGGSGVILELDVTNLSSVTVLQKTEPGTPSLRAIWGVPAPLQMMAVGDAGTVVGYHDP